MINGFGVFVMVVYPGAFVDLHTEHLLAIPPKRQLKIYCAGIWHNFVLVLIGIVMLVTMPTTMSMLYATGEGVVVTELAKVCHLERNHDDRVKCHVFSVQSFYPFVI